MGDLKVVGRGLLFVGDVTVFRHRKVSEFQFPYIYRY